MDYFKIGIFFFDFVILNLLYFSLHFLMQAMIPQFFIDNSRITVLVMNFSMLVAEYYYHAIVQQRLVRIGAIFKNSLKLVALQVGLAFVFLRIISDGGSFLQFMGIFFVVFFILIICTHFMEYWVVSTMHLKGYNAQTVVLVGNDPALLRLYDDLTMSASFGYHVKGYYADHPFRNEPPELKRLGNLKDLNERLDMWDNNPLNKMAVDEIFCSLPHDESAQVKRIMQSCDKNVVRFYYVPRIFEDYEMNFKMQRIGDYMIFTNHVEPLHNPFNRVIKRTFDLAVSFVICLFLLPLTILVGIIIKLQSPGPIFFTQSRTGIDGKTFHCFKFRSMHVNKDSDSVQATKDDPRKFPFGNFMRKTNIDELPQFFNVLRGDMSIVGPRPHMLRHTEMYGKLIDKYMVRHFCKPGITGWSQVTGYRGETQELWQMEERVKRDIWYIENWTFGLDLRIIWLTTKSVFIHDKHAY